MASKADFQEVKQLAARMDVLGKSILQALAHDEWSPTIFAQLSQRDSFYTQLTQLWSDRQLEWTHPPFDVEAAVDIEIENASHDAYDAITSLLSQNAELEKQLTGAMMNVDIRLKQTVQRKKIDQAYHPQADFTGGFVAEER